MELPKNPHADDRSAWQVLFEITKHINSSLDLDTVMERILDRGLEAVGAKLGWISLVRSSGAKTWLEMVAARGFSPVDIPGGGRFELGMGLTGTAAVTGRPYYSPDVSREANYVQILPEIRSELVVPLAAHGEVVGVLNAESTGLDGFTDRDRDLLSSLAEAASLAVTNAQRHAEVSEDLRAARERAAVAERLSAVGEVAGDMIHWVANRAGIIPNAVESIRAEMSEVPPSIGEDLDMISRNAREILRLKKAFLGDAADERPAAVSLTERLSSAAERLVPPTVELRVEIDRAAEKITAAPEAFDRILAVLLENAVQAMDSRGALVIRASRPAGSARVRIDVADSGPGVPQDVRRRIFNPFFSTKRRTGGTGMGLWFAYRSAARMGGELTLVDAGGAASRGAASPGGAVFRLELPAAD